MVSTAYFDVAYKRTHLVLFFSILCIKGHSLYSWNFQRVNSLTGWLDCPSFGQVIDCFIPSKVPLSEAFNECIPPGKRYSFKQVIHQQRVMGRKVSFPFFSYGVDGVPVKVYLGKLFSMLILVMHYQLDRFLCYSHSDWKEGRCHSSRQWEAAIMIEHNCFTIFCFIWNRAILQGNFFQSTFLWKRVLILLVLF